MRQIYGTEFRESGADKRLAAALDRNDIFVTEAEKVDGSIVFLIGSRHSSDFEIVPDMAAAVMSARELYKVLSECKLIK